MTQGFAILSALLIGVPVWFWGQTTANAAWYDVILSFSIVTSFCYGVGWVVGFAIKKIKTG